MNFFKKIISKLIFNFEEFENKEKEKMPDKRKYKILSINYHKNLNIGMIYFHLDNDNIIIKKINDVCDIFDTETEQENDFEYNIKKFLSREEDVFSYIDKELILIEKNKILINKIKNYTNSIGILNVFWDENSFSNTILKIITEKGTLDFDLENLNSESDSPKERIYKNSLAVFNYFKSGKIEIELQKKYNKNNKKELEDIIKNLLE